MHIFLPIFFYLNSCENSWGNVRLFDNRFMTDCLMVGSGDQTAYWISGSGQFQKHNCNKQSSTCCNSLANSSYNSITTTLSKSSLFWFCIFAASIWVSAYIFYFRLAIDERQKALQNGKAVLIKIAPQIMFFSFLVALCVVFQVILVQAARAAILDRNNYYYTYFPVPKAPYTDRPSFMASVQAVSQWIDAQNAETIRLFQEYFPFLNRTLNSLRQKQSAVTAQQTQIAWAQVNTEIRRLNNRFYGQLTTLGRLISYRSEIINLTKTENTPFTNQLVNILNKIPMNTTLDNISRLSFKDVQQTFWQHQMPPESLKLFCEVCNLYKNFDAGTISNISEASANLAHLNLSAKKFSWIAESSVKGATQQQIADRISRVVITASTDANFQPAIRESVSVLASAIAQSPRPSFWRFTLGRVLAQIPMIAKTAIFCQVVSMLRGY